MSCVEYGWEHKNGQLAVTWDSTPVVAKASSGGWLVAGARVVAVQEHARGGLPNVSLAPQYK